MTWSKSKGWSSWQQKKGQEDDHKRKSGFMTAEVPLTWIERMCKIKNSKWQNKPIHSSMSSKFQPKGRVQLPNRMNFRKSAKGGTGVISNPKICVAVFGNFEQAFLSMKLIQKSSFRVQGMFLQQLYWEKSKQDTLWRRLYRVIICNCHFLYLFDGH